MTSDNFEQASIPFFSPDSHGINIGVATQTKSMAAAVLLNHIIFWLKHNKTKNVNQFDGRTWMYQSAPEMANYFPYLSEQQIKDGLSLLVKNGYLIKGNYSNNKFDRTNWYAACREDWIEIKKMFAIGSTDPMHSVHRPDGQSLQTRCYNDKDIETDIEKNMYTPPSSAESLTLFFFSKLKELNPSLEALTAKQLLAWSRVFQSMLETDGRSEADIRQVIVFICEADKRSKNGFMYTRTVCQPSGLRKQWDQLFYNATIKPPKAEESVQDTKAKSREENKTFAAQKLAEIKERLPEHLEFKISKTDLTLKNHKTHVTNVIGFDHEQFKAAIKTWLKKEGLS